MTEPIIIRGQNEEEIQQRLAAYFEKEEIAFEHTISLQQGNQMVLLEVDIDPGGGFESGYAITRFSAPVMLQQSFLFTIHPEGFLAELGKLLGLQDEVIGYPGFDDKMIIKTNNKQKVHDLFSDETVRQSLTEMDSFNLQLKNVEEVNGTYILLLEIEEGIVEADELMKLYHTFYSLILSLGRLA